MRGMVIICVATLIPFSAAFRTQSVAVKGKLLCGDKPASGVIVKLSEDDGFNLPDPDDVIGQVKTSADGTFSLTGSTAELSVIEPELKIYHDCNDQHKACLRRWLIRIPSRYITDGETPTETLEIGTLNLEVQLEKEQRRCISQ